MQEAPDYEQRRKCIALDEIRRCLCHSWVTFTGEYLLSLFEAVSIALDRPLPAKTRLDIPDPVDCGQCGLAPFCPGSSLDFVCKGRSDQCFGPQVRPGFHLGLGWSMGERLRHLPERWSFA